MCCYNFSIKFKNSGDFGFNQIFYSLIYFYLEETMTTQNFGSTFFTDRNFYTNSCNSENLKKALEFQKRQEKEHKIKKIKKFTKRFSVSIFIPILITLLVSVIFTFAIKTGENPNNASFSKNFFYFFSKIFFVSIPAMMWFIYRK